MFPQHMRVSRWSARATLRAGSSSLAARSILPSAGNVSVDCNGQSTLISLVAQGSTNDKVLASRHDKFICAERSGVYSVRVQDFLAPRGADDAWGDDLRGRWISEPPRVSRAVRVACNWYLAGDME